MKNILLITKREYLTQVKKKSFVVLTILAPVMMLGFGLFIAYLMNANKSTYKIDVLDNSGMFDGKMKSNDQVQFVFLNPNSEKQLIGLMKEKKGDDGLLVFSKIENYDFDKLEKDTKLLVNATVDQSAKKMISNQISEIIKQEKIKKLGLQQSQIDDLDKNFELKTQNVLDNNSEDNDMVFGVKSVLAMLLMYATFMFIIIYGVRVMRSVLEEKNNRVVEIIISSVKPFDLMMGKIFGVTLVALTQFVVWIGMTVVGALFFNAKSANLEIAKQLPNNNIDVAIPQNNMMNIIGEVSHSLLSLNYPLIISVFILFFLLGYIFYSSMYAAIGSAVDNDTETQQFTLFAIIPLMIGVYGSFTIMNNPDGPLAFWLSIVPFTSPVAMIARIPFGVPIWQILLSLFLLIITTLFMVFVASKIYRIGILMYGNKASLKEIWKWIRS
ncbi:MAG: ABC transporter permease [Bacteroidetes bacterium]|nr:ABC transporter permease [Bacteroidota bacterium]